MSEIARVSRKDETRNDDSDEDEEESRSIKIASEKLAGATLLVVFATTHDTPFIIYFLAKALLLFSQCFL